MPLIDKPDDKTPKSAPVEQKEKRQRFGGIKTDKGGRPVMDKYGRPVLEKADE